MFHFVVTEPNSNSFVCLCCSGCGHAVSNQPRVEELHPWLHVQRLGAGADGGKLVQAKTLVLQPGSCVLFGPLGSWETSDFSVVDMHHHIPKDDFEQEHMYLV